MKNYLEAVNGELLWTYAEAEEMAKSFDGDFIELGMHTEGYIIPTYMTEKAVGADCFAGQDVTIQPGEIKAVPIGVKAKFDGEELGLFPFIRSSIPKKKGLMLANGVGVVEEDYHGNPDNDGNIGFMFFNFRSEPVTIKRFERIGQLVLLPIKRFDNAGRAGLERGASGSTGK